MGLSSHAGDSRRPLVGVPVLCCFCGLGLCGRRLGGRVDHPRARPESDEVEQDPPFAMKQRFVGHAFEALQLSGLSVGLISLIEGGIQKTDLSPAGRVLDDLICKGWRRRHSLNFARNLAKRGPGNALA